MHAARMKVARNETQMDSMATAQPLGTYSNGTSDMSNRLVGSSLDTPICIHTSDIDALHSENKLQQISTNIDAHKRKAVIYEENNTLHAKLTKAARTETPQQNLCHAETFGSYQNQISSVTNKHVSGETSDYNTKIRAS